MKTIVAAVLLAFCAALPHGALGAAPVPAGGAESAEATASRQVLVMLRLPAQHFQPDAAYAGRYPDDSGRAARRRAAQEIARVHGLKVVDDWPMPAIGIDCFVMEHDGQVSTERVLEALARDQRVLWAQPMNVFHGLDGGDPLYALQPAGKDWHLAELHRASTGRAVRIAIVDSGIDSVHPDLAGQIQLRQNFVDATPDSAEAHGTAIAGIIAARAGNGAGIAGVAPEARLLALRACWQTGSRATRCNSFTLGKAINFAIMHDARIINLSLSGPADPLLQSLLDVAARRGMAVVGAVDPLRPDGGFPASWPGVIAVAMDTDGHAATGPGVLLAPGTDIPTATPGAQWGFVSGPSYAAAHVAGLLALVAQWRPAANAAQLRHEIMTALNGGALRKLPVATDAGPQAGNIDACATIARVTGACACSCTPTAAMKAIHNP